MKKLLVVALFISTLFLFPSSLHAAECDPSQDNCDGGAAPQNGVGLIIPPYGSSLGTNSPGQSLCNYVATLVLVVMYIALILALMYMVYGGIKWITGGGDAKASQSARDTIFNAFIGVVLLAIAVATTHLLSGVAVGGGICAKPGTPGTGAAYNGAACKISDPNSCDRSKGFECQKVLVYTTTFEQCVGPGPR
jgi:hypothetical protein